MTMSTLDTGKVADHVRKVDARRAAHPVKFWLGTRGFSIAFAFVFFVGVLPLISGLPEGSYDPRGWLLWMRVGVACLTLALTWVTTMWLTPGAQASVEAKTAYAEQEFAKLTAPGWKRRFFRIGILIGLAVGGVVGPLVAWVAPDPGSGWGVRVLVFFGFMLATMAWTIPMAFLIRWISFRSYRRYLAG